MEYSNVRFERNLLSNYYYVYVNVCLMEKNVSARLVNEWPFLSFFFNVIVFHNFCTLVQTQIV